jgi:hypothetical protein
MFLTSALVAFVRKQVIAQLDGAAVHEDHLENEILKAVEAIKLRIWNGAVEDGWSLRINARRPTGELGPSIILAG